MNIPKIVAFVVEDTIAEGIERTRKAVSKNASIGDRVKSGVGSIIVTSPAVIGAKIGILVVKELGAIR